MKKFSLNGNWQLFAIEPDKNINTPDELISSGIKSIDANVPGNVELDLQKVGLLPEEIFKGLNIQQAEKYEQYDWWYKTEFENCFAGEDVSLSFDGVDTLADYWLNGKLIGSSDNMLISHAFDINDYVVEGKNTLYIHIKSAVRELNKMEFDVHNVYAHPMRVAKSIGLRKTAHSFGWDIMPRAVSAGIWRDVNLCAKEEVEFNQLYYNTVKISKHTANLRFCWELSVPVEFEDLRVEIHGKCGDSEFNMSENVYFKLGKVETVIENPKLWFPYGYGDANLYETTVCVYRGDKKLAEKKLNVGLRTVKLDRTETTDGINGKFCFYINNVPVMCKGSNWVPLDVYHSQDNKRLDKAMELVSDIGCNILRCWGGNVYESEEFYDYCDSHGIMVWQDFSFACGGYPQNEEFYEKVRKEVNWAIRKLRNRASIILWSGDNECDAVMSEFGANPMKNKITREVIPMSIYNNDPSRPYLPSSPCYNEETFATNNFDILSEYHLWGVRDYYKTDYYSKSKAHFVSETGYHGCPSVESLKKFINDDCLWPTNNEEWILHSSDQFHNPARVNLMHTQIDEMFAFKPQSIEEFSLASQISMAEAKKFFVERVRCKKPIKTGVIWWNLLDGWPQVSDAVVDYYFDKKLAYHNIKVSQQPFCIMFDEIQNSFCDLVAVNDTLVKKSGTYRVKRGFDEVVVKEGTFEIAENGQEILAKIPVLYSDHEMFIIEWEIDGKKYCNHYIAGYPPFDFEWYKKCYEKLAKMYK